MRSLGNFGFPPFTRTVKALVILCTAIWFVQFLLGRSGHQEINNVVLYYFGLTPTQVLHGKVWQLVTYSFLHASIGHVFFNMLSLWMFGSQLEQDWGRQRFLEFYFFSVVGGGLCTVAVSYAHILGMNPWISTVGASGGIFGLLVAYGILYAKQRLYIYGIFPIQARWLAIIWVGLGELKSLCHNLAHERRFRFGNRTSGHPFRFHRRPCFLGEQTKGKEGNHYPRIPMRPEVSFGKVCRKAFSGHLQDFCSAGAHCAR